MSSPSIRILPPAGSTRRHSVLIRVVFPLPVLPTTPMLFPASKVQVMPFRTKEHSGDTSPEQPTRCSSAKIYANHIYANHRIKIYVALTFRSKKSILLSGGHEGGGLFSSMIAGGSDGICINCLICSAEMMLFSALEYHRVKNTCVWERLRE